MLSVTIGLRVTSHSPRATARDSLIDAPVACHEIDASGVVTFVNSAETRLLGLPAESILRHRLWEFVAPEQQEASRSAVERKLAGQQELRVFEREYVRPDGNRLVLEIHEMYLRGETGRIEGMRSFLIDITQRRLAEQALRDSEQRYRHLVEHASDIIFRADLQG